MFIFTYYLDGNPEPIKQKVDVDTVEEGENLLRVIFVDRLLEIVKIEEEQKREGPRWQPRRARQPKGRGAENERRSW